MNINTFKKVLPAFLKHNLVPFLWGSQGVGKTTVIKQYCKENNMECIVLNPATQEVGDLIGLLIKSADGQSVFHAKPEWFPTEGKGIIFIDEANRAHPDVIQALFSLPTERRIHRHILPEGWGLVFAGNYQTDKFNVTDTSDSAWISRFCHIDFKPEVVEFTDYCDTKGFSSVASFITEHHEMLEDTKKDTLDYSMIRPDRRSWAEMIGKLEDESSIEDSRFEIYKGIVGQTAAAAFQTFKINAARRLRGRDVLSNFSKIKHKIEDMSGTSEVRFDLLNTAVDEILLTFEKRQLKDNELTNLKDFLVAIPAELGLAFFKKLHKSTNEQKNQILNDAKFVQLYENNKQLKKFKK